jgi:hypothetical protein
MLVTALGLPYLFVTTLIASVALFPLLLLAGFRVGVAYTEFWTDKIHTWKADEYFLWSILGWCIVFGFLAMPIAAALTHY